jgi:hypothetical protein
MIEVMQESDRNVIAFRISQRLTDDDYMRTFVPKWEELVEEYGKCRMLMVMDESYQGIELRVLWHDAKFGVKHRRDFDKMAVVGAPKWIERVMKLSGQIVAGEMRAFPTDGLQEALDWVRS